MLSHLLILFLLLAQQDHRNLSRDGLALGGYDPVSYFMSEPTPGTAELKLLYKEAVYHFTSIENQQVFLRNPDRYLPQYGGWCAYALGKRPDKVRVDPKTFKIIGDKLYLFYNFRGYNTLELWNKNEKSLLPEADANWAKIVN